MLRLDLVLLAIGLICLAIVIDHWRTTVRLDINCTLPLEDER